MAHAILIIGLVYGDEGKGATVDRYTRGQKASLVVKMGGPQCAHNVVTSDGRHFTFQQFGSGTFAGAQTHLSRNMLVNPLFLRDEVRDLQAVGVPDPYSLLTAHRDAIIITPFQVAANRLREAHRNKNRHGSCGHGINEAVTDALATNMPLRVGDLLDPDTVRYKLQKSQEFKQIQMGALLDGLTKWDEDRDQSVPISEDIAREWDILYAPVDRIVELYREFAERVRIVGDEYLRESLKKPGTVIFENGQGVLLDQSFGWFPYVTRRDTTFGPALDLLEGRPATRLGVMRSYATRHGAGPFVTENATLGYPEAHNRYGQWQEGFRLGNLDLVALDYAIRAVRGVDGIVLTHMDRVNGPQKVCVGYQDPLQVNLTLPETIPEQQQITESLLGIKPNYEEFDDLVTLLERFAPVVMTADGPTAEDYHERREPA